MDPRNTPGVRIRSWNDDRQRNGTASTIFSLGEPDKNSTHPCWLQFHYEPGWYLPAHAHAGWTTTVILEGSWAWDGVEFGPGEVLIAAPKVMYGPFTPGPNGVTALEFFENQDAVPPIWDEESPEVKTMLERLGASAASIYQQHIV